MASGLTLTLRAMPTWRERRKVYVPLRGAVDGGIYEVRRGLVQNDVGTAEIREGAIPSRPRKLELEDARGAGSTREYFDYGRGIRKLGGAVNIFSCLGAAKAWGTPVDWAKEEAA